MRIVWLAVVGLLACKDDAPPAKQSALEAKEKAVEVAQKAADEAKQAMHAAQAKAAEAWQRVEAARADHAKASEERAKIDEKLVELRKEAAETIKLADAKLVDLG